MRKIIRLLFALIILLAALQVVFMLKVKIDKSVNLIPSLGSLNTSVAPPGYPGAVPEVKKEVILEGIGEKMIYDVKMGKITLGKSTFTHADRVDLDGRKVHLMIFETKLSRFIDTERIYVDPETLLPVQVERDILNFFNREKITEKYDAKEFTVSISKKRGAKNETQVIKKDAPLHNAILLPHFVRRAAKLDIGSILIANLPTSRYELKLVSLEDITVPAGTFKTYHFESTPKKIEIWISADERKVPVKIQSCAAFGYVMTLREYHIPAVVIADKN